MLSLAKLGAGGQRYYLDQAKGRVDHRQSVASGVEDYYLAAPEAPGYWLGAKAERLGLTGRLVEEETLHRALSWTDPLTGDEFDGPIRQARVPGFDLMFSTPKSASVLFGIAEKDVRTTIRRAQEEAIDQALRYLESVACRGRLGAGGQGEGFAGRGFLAAAFEHRTSRAGDPQLHTHVLVANAVQRPDGKWAALDGRLIYAHAKTAGFVHEAAFRRALTRDLGVQWERPVNGIADIRGVSQEVLDAFSRRSHEIDAYVRQREEGSAAARQIAAVRTREAKDYGVTPAELLPEWRERAASLGLTQSRAIGLLGRARSGERAGLRDERVLERLAGRDGLTRCASHFDRRHVIQALAELAREGASLDELQEVAERFLATDHAIPLTVNGDRNRSEVIRRADGRTVAAMPAGERYTTPALLDAERRVLPAPAQRRDEKVAIAEPAAIQRALANRPTIGDDQARMVERLLTSGEGVQIVVGPAGSGKTFGLDAARAAWEESGVCVRGAAVARAAAHVLYDQAGIESTSVAALLQALRRGRRGALPEGGVLVIDEAGMLGTLDLDEILRHAAAKQTKVVLIGDPHQLPEIDAGGCFRALAANPDVVTLTENRRQRHAHDQRKVELLRSGAAGEALAIACERGDVVVGGNGDALLEQMVADYCGALATDATAVMVAARRSDVAELNAHARARIDGAGKLGAERLELAGGEFAVGDVVVIKRNERRLGVQNGNRGRVVALDPQQRAMRVALADGRIAALNARFLADAGTRHEPSLVHGHAATAHVMQGQTAERVFVLGSESIYREWGYVALTRARERTRFYVCDAGDDRTLTSTAAALDDSQAQQTALSILARNAVTSLPTEDLVAQRERLARVLAADPTAAEGRALKKLQHELQQAQSSLEGAKERRRLAGQTRRGMLRRRGGHDLLAEHDETRAAERVAGLVAALHDRRAAPRWADAHAEDIARHSAVVDELDARARARQRAYRHAAAPRYITDALGPRPEAIDARAVWDQALCAVERYRARHGVNDPWRALGARPPAHDAASWATAKRELERAQRVVGRDVPGRER